MTRQAYAVIVRDESSAVLYSRIRRGTANGLLAEAQRRFPAWHSVDVAIVADAIHIHETRPHTCARCGQRITDGKPCGCGAR